jgi:hypothetical protein
MARRAKNKCKGTAVNEDGSCTKCFRDVRVKNDGTTYSHYPKAPSNRTDPRHTAYILKTYGITGEQYMALLAAQDGKCFICEKAPKSKRLAVDHDHDIPLGEPGHVRGLLCRRCNHRLLGSAHDATRILYRAIEYLTNPPAKDVLYADDGP